MKTKILPALLAICCILIQSCGSTHISVPVTRPAEVNMSKYKKITVAGFRGRAGDHFSTEVTSALVSSKMFDVLDRSNLDLILSELGLTYDGITGNPGLPRGGKLAAPTALVTGEVSLYDYKEEQSVSEPYEDKKGKHKDYIVTGKAEITVNFMITDLSSGKIIFSKMISGTTADTKTRTDARPERINKERLFEQGRRKVIQDFMNRVVPHVEYENVKFLIDSDVPDYAKGVEFAENGLWEKAADAFHAGYEAANEKQKKSKGMYNLGIAYQYSFLFDQALESFDKAYSLFPDGDYLDAMKKCKIMEEDHKMLLEQSR